MIIPNIAELRRIFNVNNTLFTGVDAEFILLNTQPNVWREEITGVLHATKAAHLHVALVVNHPDKRVDTILVSCRKMEINAELLKQFEYYIHGGNEKDSVLTFLEKQWQTNSSAYAMTIMLTSQPIANYSILSYRAIAPHYREQGLMKVISLNVIEALANEFGQEHRILSFAIHKATYLFFNPKDKGCVNFNDRELQELTCHLLLKAHGRINEEKTPEIFINPDWVVLLSKLGIFKTDSPASAVTPISRISP